MTTKTKVKSKVAVRTGVLVAVVLLSALIISAYGVAFGLRRAAKIAERPTPTPPVRCLGLKVEVEKTPTLLKIEAPKEVTFVIENPDRACSAKITGAQFRISSENRVEQFRRATLIIKDKEIPFEIRTLPADVNVGLEREGLVIRPGDTAKLKVAFEPPKDLKKSITVEILRASLTWQDAATGITYRDPLQSVTGFIEGKAGVEVTERFIEIKDLTVTLRDPRTAVITFVTNEIATSEIEYGTTRDLRNKVSGSAGKDHSITLNVNPDARYYYKVTAKGQDLLPATTPVYTFMTASELPGVSGSGAGGTGATDERPTGESSPEVKDVTGAQGGAGGS